MRFVSDVACKRAKWFGTLKKPQEVVGPVLSDLSRETRLVGVLGFYHVPYRQCAWFLPSFCTAPRADHAIRTVPAELIAPYVAARDTAIYVTWQACAGHRLCCCEVAQLACIGGAARIRRLAVGEPELHEVLSDACSLLTAPSSKQGPC